MESEYLDIPMWDSAKEELDIAQASETVPGAQAEFPSRQVMPDIDIPILPNFSSDEETDEDMEQQEEMEDDEEEEDDFVQPKTLAEKLHVIASLGESIWTQRLAISDRRRENLLSNPHPSPSNWDISLRVAEIRHDSKNMGIEYDNRDKESYESFQTRAVEVRRRRRLGNQLRPFSRKPLYLPPFEERFDDPNEEELILDRGRLFEVRE